MTLTKHDFTEFHWVENRGYEPAKMVYRGGGWCMHDAIKASAEFTAVPKLPMAPGTIFAFTSDDLPDLLRGVAFGVVATDGHRIRAKSGFVDRLPA